MFLILVLMSGGPESILDGGGPEAFRAQVSNSVPNFLFGADFRLAEFRLQISPSNFVVAPPGKGDPLVTLSSALKF